MRYVILPEMSRLKSCKITNEGAVELAKGLAGNRSISVLEWDSPLFDLLFTIA